MERTTIGLDLAKRVFQVHTVDVSYGCDRAGSVKAQPGIAVFCFNRQPAVIAMEACGSARHWARELVKLGHEVRLIAARLLRPFVKTNKTDAADAEGIWEAAQRPGDALCGAQERGAASGVGDCIA